LGPVAIFPNPPIAMLSNFGQTLVNELSAISAEVAFQLQLHPLMKRVHRLKELIMGLRLILCLVASATSHGLSGILATPIPSISLDETITVPDSPFLNSKGVRIFCVAMHSS
jgi:hypothetical protein